MIQLESNSWGNQGWFEGVVVRIDPYSAPSLFLLGGTRWYLAGHPGTGY